MEKKGTGAEHVSYRHNVFRNKMLGFEKNIIYHNGIG